ncbi:hypothetical protein [Haloactinopolyspora sp.]|uniref:hypothetical protein n=1 Tax=Haloactinopolyspora sp. TaxID=1966353 RepID=UPI002634C8F4|nr:hypothetical protein [Haloactinopolyspora sp.]
MPSSILRRPAMRWAVPAGVTAVVVTAAAVGPVIAGADSELPDRTAAEILVGLAGARDVAFSGTVVQSADLGLPDLPETGAGDAGSTGATALSLLTGSTTARVWYSGDDSFRVALQDELAETDIIHHDGEAWFWNSEHNVVKHATLPEGEPGPASPMPSMPSMSDAPAGATDAMAEMALQAIAPTTNIEVDGTATVAGRDAYELVVSPKDDDSLIGSIRLAVDGEHFVPLRIQVYSSQGGDPAFEMGFTSVSFSEPDESVYEFTPPAGAEVEEIDPGERPMAPHGPDEHGPDEHPGVPEGAPEPDDVSVVGDGWTSVLVARGVDVDELTSSVDEDMMPLVEAILGEFDEVSGEYGTGRAMTNDIVSVLLLDDGRLLVGAVPIDVLEEAAMSPEAAA